MYSTEGAWTMATCQFFRNWQPYWTLSRRQRGRREEISFGRRFPITFYPSYILSRSTIQTWTYVEATPGSWDRSLSRIAPFLMHLTIQGVSKVTGNENPRQIMKHLSWKLACLFQSLLLYFCTATLFFKQFTFMMKATFTTFYEITIASFKHTERNGVQLGFNLILWRFNRREYLSGCIHFRAQVTP